MLLKIFCGVIPMDWYLVADVSNDLDDENITIIFNAGNYLPFDTTRYRRSLDFSSRMVHIRTVQTDTNYDLS